MCEEAPGTEAVAGGGVGDADTGGGGMGWGGFAATIVFEPEALGGDEAFGVEGAGNLEVAGEFARAVETFDAADEDGFGEIFISADDVEEVVDSVAEVDVGVSAFGVHDIGAWSASFAGVAGGVVFTVIGFRFCDTDSEYRIADFTAEYFTEKLRGEHKRRLTIKRGRKT